MDIDVGKVVLHAGPVQTVVDLGDAGDIVPGLFVDLLNVVAARHRDARLLGDWVAAVDLVGDDHHAVAAVAALPICLIIIVAIRHGSAAAARTGVGNAGGRRSPIQDIRRIAADARTTSSRLSETTFAVVFVGISAAAARAEPKRLAKDVAFNARTARATAEVGIGTGGQPLALAAATAAGRIRAHGAAFLLMVAVAAVVAVYNARHRQG